LKENSSIIVPKNFISDKDVLSNESNITETAMCSSNTDKDIQQTSLNIQFGKAAECIKRLITYTQSLEHQEEIKVE
jgi:hypothetical protein